MHRAIYVVAVGVGDHHLGYVAELKARRGHGGRQLELARHVHARECHVLRLGGLTGVEEP